MSEECTHTCGSCTSDCSEREQQDSFRVRTNEMSEVKKVIAVVSGKGGVGKSLVTSLLAVLSQRKGYQTAILDADITGPSIPKTFGINKKAEGNELGIFPVETKTGIELMSINLLLEQDTDPVVWRGPVIAGTVKQFWSDVIWNQVDYMFVDMPPGTGDVPLTVFQSLPVEGIIIVTSPQELVSMIVEKAVKMAELMKVPILGMVENMSYFICPNCKEKHTIFGESHLEDIAEKYGIQTIAKIPMDPDITSLCDKGLLELFEGDWLDQLSDQLDVLLGTDGKENRTMNIAVTYENGEIFQHFGHTEQFKLYQTENDKIVSSGVVSSEGSGHGALAGFLLEQGVNTLICGGIGDGAKAALDEAGITLYAGVTGNADEAVEKLLDHKLDFTTDSNCDHHHEEHTCGEHSCGNH